MMPSCHALAKDAKLVCHLGGVAGTLTLRLEAIPGIITLVRQKSHETSKQ